jgi:hypothetical protein
MKLLEVDSRRRVSLGPLAKSELYLVEVEEDGTIILTPAVVVPAVVHEQTGRLPDS